MTGFICNGNEWRESQIAERERERETDRETECCCKRVMAWAINLTVGENIYDS
jgi:hypothetical protein